ncbi:MAG: ABC transporter permease subunit [Holophagales bacterium]|nr:ABC transporter permease subunit [Holophagales bacterium]
MNARTVLRLVRKDCSLMRAPLVAWVLVALASLALTALVGGRFGRTAGSTLALNVLIGVSFHVMLGPVLGERERRTLAFVVSLPVTPGEVAVAKLTSAFTLFLLPGVTAATALVWATPFDIPARMAASHDPLWVHALGMLAYHALVLGGWLLFFSVVLAVAIVTESVGWTIGTLVGLMFVMGNIVLQLLPALPGFGAYLRALGKGEPALPVTIACEAAGVAAVVWLIVALQKRKTSFV